VLGGAGAVQIDESMFGGRCKYHRGDHAKHQQSWVLGLVEENTGLCVFWAVDNRTKETLVPLIKDHVVRNTTIKTDLWKAYGSLSEEGYTHLTVNHSLNFVSVEGIHTQLIESLWSQLKSSLKVRRGTSSAHLAGHLDYYSFRCFAKHCNRSTFDVFLDLIKADNCY
jgi:transposase-like protein